VAAANPRLAAKFDIWGGTKLLQFSGKFRHVAERHAHLLTAGQVLSAVLSTLEADRASRTLVIETLVARGLSEHQYTKLDQAGSLDDQRPGIHHLYVDLPYKAVGHEDEGLVLEALTCTSGRNHGVSEPRIGSDAWGRWERSPRRAKIWFVRGGPGQGKSTIGQFFCQIHRAALWAAMEPKRADLGALADAIREHAKAAGVWPTAPRVPVYIELKKYSQWFGEREPLKPTGVESYLAELLTGVTQQTVGVGALRTMLASGRWVVVFDGLDEVPGPLKDRLADEIREFIHGTARSSDLLTICTSRPQGYSGQFDSLSGADLHLTPLPKGIAFECARRVAAMGRTETEAKASEEILRRALKSDAVGELMTSPLQAHIMAVIVRSGQHPPERKWELYRRFYDVILAREASKGFELLRRESVLIKGVHNKLGFVLHCDAERADGALASLSKATFRSLVASVVREKRGEEVPELTERIMVASTERLVLINTPEKGTVVRFDIRQIQEFFAAEFLCDGASPEQLDERVAMLGADAHWREVLHFVLSALAENNRKADLSVVLKVLEAIDDSHSAPEERDLGRALARGAVLSAALLRDGVLEQDHGVRSLFWKSLEPLVAARDEQAVESLLHVEGEASRRWLCALMVAEFENRLPFQVVGAFRVLWQLLRDGEPEVERVRKKLTTSKFVPLDVGIARMAFENDVPFARWHAATIVDALDQPALGCWWAIAAAFRHTPFASGVTEEIVKRYGPSWSVLPDLFRTVRSREEWKVVGPFRVARSALASVPELAEVPEDSAALPFGLRLLATAGAYARTGSRDDLLEFLDVLNGNSTALLFLPSELVPIDATNRNALAELRGQLENMDPAEFEASKFGWTPQNIAIGWAPPEALEHDEIAQSLREAIREYPSALPSLVRYLTSESLEKPGVTELVREQLRTHPRLLGALDPRVWGRLIGDDEPLRLQLRQECRDVEHWRVEQMTGERWAPFRVDLPIDAILLPRILGCVLGPPHSHRGRPSETIKLLLGLFGLDVGRLSSLARGVITTCHQSERVAAILLTLLCPDVSVSDVINEHSEYLLQAASDGNQVVHELGRCGTLVNGLVSTPFRVLSSSLMRLAWEKGEGGDIWELVVADWRQRSTSPSLTTGARDTWCK